jgi:hypothetical protein
LASGWEETVAELERATARLALVRTEDFLEIAQAMNERSAAISRLRDLAESPGEQIPPVLLDRLKADFRNGEAVSHRVLLMRAGARAEASQLAESTFLARSLRACWPKHQALVDCTG